MTQLAAIPFATLEFEDQHFLVFGLGYDLSVNGHPGDLGLADLDILAVGQ
ncbi:hypothetical protein DESC_780104 [Desulfosarcina cetonica]|nr:hypothetical protein DESC_780104 [Desulfosarcina cetonica]